MDGSPGWIPLLGVGLCTSSVARESLGGPGEVMVYSK